MIALVWWRLVGLIILAVLLLFVFLLWSSKNDEDNYESMAKIERRMFVRDIKLIVHEVLVETGLLKKESDDA